jgi:hypothetical protein
MALAFKTKLYFVAQLFKLRHWSRLGKPCYFSALNKNYGLQKNQKRLKPNASLINMSFQQIL